MGIFRRDETVVMIVFQAYEQPVIPITVEAEPTSENAPFLKLAKETLFRELSGVLEDVQLSQVRICKELLCSSSLENSRWTEYPS